MLHYSMSPIPKVTIILTQPPICVIFSIISKVIVFNNFFTFFCVIIYKFNIIFVFTN